jgi:hypothetical protein
MSDIVTREGKTVSVRRGAVLVERTFGDEAIAWGIAERLKKHKGMRDRFLTKKSR